jgi:excinuclease ABC subunit A
MVSYSDEQIKDLITQDFTNKRINILAPVIRARKGPLWRIVPTNSKTRIPEGEGEWRGAEITTG